MIEAIQFNKFKFNDYTRAMWQAWLLTQANTIHETLINSLDELPEDFIEEWINESAKPEELACPGVDKAILRMVAAKVGGAILLHMANDLTNTPTILAPITIHIERSNKPNVRATIWEKIKKDPGDSSHPPGNRDH